ncbi:MAG: hypothetical protein HC840_13065 [Leptolyngbyaceae cyanobacterium RM2_2_4]|nr:hypothetical protein [Leptolyngbyaceae cyanobacterium SL_5_14]NJO50209.1 hypothetical protein [Leptolyngbyaceae cyanobacterium RM2_2_4]NJO67294.1 hypothetical protein [Leptolyngbyaceae cyanobacterium RM1_405_57]
MHQPDQQTEYSKEYIRTQVSFHLCAPTAAAREDALYRIATHIELVPCTGHSLEPHERQKTLGWLYDNGYLNGGAQ